MIHAPTFYDPFSGGPEQPHDVTHLPWAPPGQPDPKLLAIALRMMMEQQPQTPQQGT